MKALVTLLRQAALALMVATVCVAQPAEPSRVVIVPVLNLYSAPSLDADVVSQAIYATAVKVLEDQGSWARIHTPDDDYVGWVESASLLTPPRPYASGTDVVHVSSLYAHVYREASVTKHAPLLTVPFEARLEVERAAPQTEGWLAVRLLDGRTGYVQRGDVASTGPPLTAEQTIALSKKFLGLPYTWGGTSSYGYDCSGFMQMLMRQRGYSMPRDAGPQANWTGSVPVEKADVQPGDLLYFGSSIEKVTHTGLYLGAGQFINATTYSTPMVRIDNLDEPRWTKLLVAIRRVKP